MRKVKILDKEFKLSIPSASIKHAVDEIASRINNDYAGEEVLFVSVLNGAFVFSADLIHDRLGNGQAGQHPGVLRGAEGVAGERLA